VISDKKKTHKTTPFKVDAEYKTFRKSEIYLSKKLGRESQIFIYYIFVKKIVIKQILDCYPSQASLFRVNRGILITNFGMSQH